MILVDENAELTMMHMLKAYQQHPHESYGIYLAFPAKVISSETLKTAIIESVRPEVSLQDVHAYFFENGTVHLIAKALYPREANRVTARIMNTMDVNALQCGYRHYDLRQEAPKILHLLEQHNAEMEQKKRETIETRKKQQEEAIAVLKRRAILESAISADAAMRIQQQRGERKVTEIMMIEDDPFSRHLAENILRQTHQVTSLGEPQSALSTYERVAPDILFLDINLPDVTGHELLEKILRLDPQAYVVMLSGNADRENVMEALKRGAKGFVAKPFTPEKLYQYIQRCPTMH